MVNASKIRNNRITTILLSHYFCDLIVFNSFYNKNIVKSHNFVIIEDTFIVYDIIMNINWKTNKRIRQLILWGILVFLSYTSFSKMTNMNSFLLNIAKTGVFSGYFVDAVAYGAIIAEVLSIILIIVKEKLGLLFCLCMMSAFSLYILYLYTNGIYEICGCGGILNGLAFHWHILINGCIILLISYLLYEGEYKKE